MELNEWFLWRAHRIRDDVGDGTVFSHDDADDGIDGIKQIYEN